ncbi:MAG TPA: cytochrome d ubiquinol oxidase subunit II [Rickettsiales bacterium]|nr:cytochrome d ubiquinol oxidase subunit II [Rickettsiales bacterium]
MFDFSPFLNLPLIWGVIIALAVFLYVLLDGFDLGIGIIFPFAPSTQCRNKMANSIAPFWDGNETWLVLGGGGLFAAFPLAYAILLPAFYTPIIIMLLGLIARGVAFEFRFKEDGAKRKIWDITFCTGSTIAAFCQGMILGAFVQGVEVSGRNFVGGAFDFISWFSIATGFAVMCGYALLGATWLIMKSAGNTQEFARKYAFYSLIAVALFMALVTISMPFLNIEIGKLWFIEPNFLYILPLLSLIFFIILWIDLLRKKHEFRPFFLAIAIFATAYLGIAISLFPWIIPFKYTIFEAAASTHGLSLLLVGTIILLPIILAYTAYCYYIFRGKTSHENYY